ncbi:hypothetical protein PM082_007565 [Marasmius tenuissimus]|nr:hypothetical protein PM082_007565 [Marasmius tenuissimus]
MTRIFFSETRIANSCKHLKTPRHHKYHCDTTVDRTITHGCIQRRFYEQICENIEKKRIALSHTLKDWDIFRANSPETPCQVHPSGRQHGFKLGVFQRIPITRITLAPEPSQTAPQLPDLNEGNLGGKGMQPNKNPNIMVDLRAAYRLPYERKGYGANEIAWRPISTHFSGGWEDSIGVPRDVSLTTSTSRAWCTDKFFPLVLLLATNKRTMVPAAAIGSYLSWWIAPWTSLHWGESNSQTTLSQHGTVLTPTP